MIQIDGAKSTRAADIKGGNLVVCKLGQEYQYALAVSPALPAHPAGVLLLEKKPLPEFVTLNGHCLDLGERPIFQWDLADGSISDGTRESPRAGDLIASPAGTLICGIAMNKSMAQTVCAWDLTTGKMSDLDLTSAIYLKKWTLGLKDASGNFQALLPADPKLATPRATA